jgi:F-type H+-transporting ATPase subunit b
LPGRLCGECCSQWNRDADLNFRAKKIGLLGLTLLLIGCAGVVLAQDHPDAASSQQVTSDPSQNPGGPARQLVHESREAAGEEKDSTAEFRESGSVRMISKWTGLDLQRSYWLSMITNFVVIAGLLIWACRKMLPGFFRDRTAAIQKALQEAQKASAEARARLTDIESRLAKLDGEISSMRQSAEKEAAAEEQRIKDATAEDARKIVAAAEQEIAAAAKAARRLLTAHAAELAVGLAQKQIRVDPATDQALVRNFAGKLSTASDNPGKDRN